MKDVHADTVCRNVKHRPQVPLGGTWPGSLPAAGEQDSLSFNSRRTLTVHINIYCKEGMRCVCSSETPRTRGQLPRTSARASLNSLPLRYQGGGLFCLILQAISGCTLKKQNKTKTPLGCGFAIFPLLHAIRTLFFPGKQELKHSLTTSQQQSHRCR